MQSRLRAKEGFAENAIFLERIRKVERPKRKNLAH